MCGASSEDFLGLWVLASSIYKSVFLFFFWIFTLLASSPKNTKGNMYKVLGFLVPGGQAILPRRMDFERSFC